MSPVRRDRGTRPKHCQLHPLVRYEIGVADSNSRTGKSYATPEILSWLAGFHAKHDAALESAFTSPAASNIPAIQVSQHDGAVIAWILKLARVRRVVEVGTLAGYSTIKIARAVGNVGHVWTIDNAPNHVALARRNVAAAGCDNVTFVEGNGIDALRSLQDEAPFDAIFLDADKTSYDAYCAWAVENLRPGGLLIADNVFFFGKLLEETEDAKAVRSFHERAAATFDTACIPTPDGLLVGVRS